MHWYVNYLLLILSMTLSACGSHNVKLAKDDSNIARSEQKATIAYQTGDWKTAESIYSKLTKTPLATPELWFRLGNIYAQTKRFDAAERAYKNALVGDPKNGKIWHNLGLVQLRQATGTFIEMLEHSDPDEPLNTSAKELIYVITNLMSSGFETTAKE